MAQMALCDGPNCSEEKENSISTKMFAERDALVVV